MRRVRQSRLQAEARADGRAAPRRSRQAAAGADEPGGRRDPVPHRRLRALPPGRLGHPPRHAGELDRGGEGEGSALPADGAVPAALAGVGGREAAAVPAAARHLPLPRALEPRSGAAPGHRRRRVRVAGGALRPPRRKHALRAAALQRARLGGRGSAPRGAARPPRAGRSGREPRALRCPGPRARGPRAAPGERFRELRRRGGKAVRRGGGGWLPSAEPRLRPRGALGRGRRAHRRHRHRPGSAGLRLRGQGQRSASRLARELGRAAHRRQQLLQPQVPDAGPAAAPRGKAEPERRAGDERKPRANAAGELRVVNRLSAALLARRGKRPAADARREPGPPRSRRGEERPRAHLSARVPAAVDAHHPRVAGGTGAEPLVLLPPAPGVGRP